MRPILASNYPVWFGYWYYFCLFVPFYVPTIITVRFLVQLKEFRSMPQPQRKQRLGTLAIWWGSAVLIYGTLWQSVMSW